MPKRSKEEWLSKIVEQVSFLEDFANRYDNNQLHYAIEMSIKLRVLLDNNSKEKSLLDNFCSAYLVSMPKFLNDTCFPLTMPNEKTTNYVRSNLCHFEFIIGSDGSPFAYPKPLMSKTNLLRTESFNMWWEAVTTISIGDENHTILNRKNVVRLICDKEGGAHVDEKLPPQLTALMRNEAHPLTMTFNNTIIRYVKIDELLYATIRQITYETLETLKPFLSKYI